MDIHYHIIPKSLNLWKCFQSVYIVSLEFGALFIEQERQQASENTEEDKEVVEVLKQTSATAAVTTAFKLDDTYTSKNTSMTGFSWQTGVWHFWLYTDKTKIHF